MNSNTTRRFQSTPTLPDGCRLHQWSARREVTATSCHQILMSHSVSHESSVSHECSVFHESNAACPTSPACPTSSISRFLTEDATKTLVTSYILSRLDYCNCLLMGTPNSVIQPLQKIQNFAARLVLLAPRHHHSSPLLEKLHWLPISERIKYKVACMCFSAINGSGPLTSLNCCMSTLRLVHYALLLTPAC